MSKPSYEDARELLDLRWLLVPTTVVLGALAAVLIWPVGESVPMDLLPSQDTMHAAATLPAASAPATAAQDEVAAVQEATPADETQEEDHVPTF